MNESSAKKSVIEFIENLDGEPGLVVVCKKSDIGLLRTGDMTVIINGEPVGMIDKFKLEAESDKTLASYSITKVTV